MVLHKHGERLYMGLKEVVREHLVDKVCVLVYVLPGPNADRFSGCHSVMTPSLMVMSLSSMMSHRRPKYNPVLGPVSRPES